MKKRFKEIIETVNKDGIFKGAFCKLSIEECEYLYSQGILINVVPRTYDGFYNKFTIYGIDYIKEV